MLYFFRAIIAIMAIVSEKADYVYTSKTNDLYGNYVCNIKFHIPEKNFHRFIYKLTLIMYICGHSQMMLFLI